MYGDYHTYHGVNHVVKTARIVFYTCGDYRKHHGIRHAVRLLKIATERNQFLSLPLFISTISHTTLEAIFTSFSLYKGPSIQFHGIQVFCFSLGTYLS